MRCGQEENYKAVRLRIKIVVERLSLNVERFARSFSRISMARHQKIEYECVAKTAMTDSQVNHVKLQSGFEFLLDKLVLLQTDRSPNAPNGQQHIFYYYYYFCVCVCAQLWNLFLLTIL